MKSAGSSLQNAVKAQVYIEGVENFPDFYDVWSEHFANIPCALTVVPTKSFATVGGAGATPGSSTAFAASGSFA